jgi:hypothetical protein
VNHAATAAPPSAAPAAARLQPLAPTRLQAVASRITPSTAADCSASATTAATTTPPPSQTYRRSKSHTPSVVYALTAHLTYFGDTLTASVVDPLTAIDAHMRFNGNLTAWTAGRTPTDVAAIRARAEQIARDYFDHHFPAIPW